MLTLHLLTGSCNVSTTRLLWEGPIAARVGRTEDSSELSGKHAVTGSLFTWGHHEALDNVRRQTARSSCRILVRRPQRDGSVGEVLAVQAWGPDFDPCPQSLGKEAGHSRIHLLIPGPGRKEQEDPKEYLLGSVRDTLLKNIMISHWRRHLMSLAGLYTLHTCMPMS